MSVLACALLMFAALLWYHYIIAPFLAVCVCVPFWHLSLYLYHNRKLFIIMDDQQEEHAY
jgi:hypothetical protein